MYSSESTANKGNPMSGHFSADQDSSRLVPRVVLAKPGLDGHNIGLRAVARRLRDEGVEVIYAGMMVTIDQVVSVALGEDVDVIGLSLLNGTHMTHVPEVLELVRERELDCEVMFGGVAPESDVRELRTNGLGAFFGPGSDSSAIAEYVFAAARRRRQGTE